jgi:hypothetical protein
MSFHKGGVYAVNMGLDSDNVLRIGGWSASANRWELDMSGNNWAASSFRAPIFYDSNNTAYYTDPASTSVLNGLTVGGGTIATTSGSPPYYMARAWVNFNGTGTVAIRESVNVSSITDHGAGDYTVNFSTAMPNENYAVSGMANWDGTSRGALVAINNLRTMASSSVPITTMFSSNWSLFDTSVVTVVIHR